MMDNGPDMLRGLVRSLIIRPVGLDDLSSIRYIHESSLWIHGSGHYSEAELLAFREHVYSPLYADQLLKDVLLTGWLGTELVATSGWALPLERGEAARMRAIYVRPLFTGVGIGLRMLEEAEALARKSGFTDFTARANVNSIGFFENAGYEVASHGARTLAGGVSLPVAFMRKSDDEASVSYGPRGRA